MVNPPKHNAAPSEPTADGVIYVVDDDPEVREYIRWVLEPMNCQLRTYEDPATFLDDYLDSGAACLITDVCMPVFSGLDLQEKLRDRGIVIPVIVMSAYREVPNVVRAMRDGALDFLEKPFEAETLRTRVTAALALNREARRKGAARIEATALLARLTPRQRTVLDGLLAGKPSKIIASELGVSPRTVDVHRFRLMQTMEAESLPDLFRRVMLARGQEADAPPVSSSAADAGEE